MFIGFLPKLVLRSALMSPLCVPNFSPTGVCIRILWWILQSVWKEVEKEKRKEKTLSYLRKSLSDFLQIRNVDSPTKLALL